MMFFSNPVNHYSPVKKQISCGLGESLFVDFFSNAQQMGRFPPFFEEDGGPLRSKTSHGPGRGRFLSFIHPI